MVTTDHESTQGLAFATLIGIAGLIVAAALAVVLFALRLLAAMEARLGELRAVVEGVGRLP